LPIDGHFSKQKVLNLKQQSARFSLMPAEDDTNIKIF